MYRAGPPSPLPARSGVAARSGKNRARCGLRKLGSLERLARQQELLRILKNALRQHVEVQMGASGAPGAANDRPTFARPFQKNQWDSPAPSSITTKAASTGNATMRLPQRQGVPDLANQASVIIICFCHPRKT